MAPDDVNEADRLEQEAPPTRDERDRHRTPVDAPDPDVFEQELPVVDEPGAQGLDAERVEPVSDDDWASTPPGG